jgi:hypothetical protein
MGFKAEIEDFVYNPPPPSEVHRAGVTAAAGIATTMTKLRPAYGALLGAAAVIVGHYGFRQWWMKSVGYGMIGGAAVTAAMQARKRRNDDESLRRGLEDLRDQIRDIDSGGLQNREPDPNNLRGDVPESEIISETQLLTSIELGRDLPSGQSAPQPRFVRLDVDGRLVPISEYYVLFAEKVSEARARGRARRNRRGRPEIQPQTEREYLQWVRDMCLLDSREPGADALASNPNAKSEVQLRGSRDIMLADGSFRIPSDYVVEFRDLIEQVRAKCSRDIADLRNRRPPGETFEVRDVDVVDIRDPRTDATSVTGNETLSPVPTISREVVEYADNPLTSRATATSQLYRPSAGVKQARPLTQADPISTRGARNRTRGR